MGLYKYKWYCGKCGCQFEPSGGVAGNNICSSCYDDYRERIDAVLEMGGNAEKDIQERLPQARAERICPDCGTSYDGPGYECDSCRRALDREADEREREYQREYQKRLDRL